MDALMGTFVKVNTMADGTPRLVLDMQCSLAEVAAMGLVPGVPFAVARLSKEAAVTQPEESELKGGEFAKLAGIWCKEPRFIEWHNSIYAPKIHNEAEAADFVRRVCMVKKRAHIDHDDVASMRFQELIRLPYMDYMRK